MDYLLAFLVGGALCLVAQLVLDLTRLTQAHVMVLFVALGAVASGMGLYDPLVTLGGAGATVPLPGFGHALVQGMLEGARKDGLPGLLTGGLAATALGLTAAILFGYLMSVLFTPRG